MEDVFWKVKNEEVKIGNLIFIFETKNLNMNEYL